MTKFLRQYTAFALVLVLLFSLVPQAFASETEPDNTAMEAVTTEGDASGSSAADSDMYGIDPASEDYGIMPIAGNKLSGVKLLNLASPYNYTCTLSSQVYVKYVPAGSSSAKTAGIQNMAWHYYSYDGIADKDKTIYCIQPHLDYNQGSSGNYMDQGVDVWGDNTTGSIGSNAWYALSSSQRSAIAYTLLYSEQRWDDSYSVLNYSKNNNPNYSLRVATQVLIYEIVTGLRDASSFERLDSNGYSDGRVLYDAFKDACPDFRSYYNGIVSDVQNAELLPSFCSSSSSSAPTITLDGVLTWVTDTNGVCGQFTFVEDNNDVWFNVYDTEVGFQNSYGFEGTKLYSCYKSRPSTGSSTFSVFYGSSSYQSCVALHSPATSRTTGYFKVYVPSSTGNLNITKTTQDSQNLGSWPFSLYSNSACTSLAYGPYYTNSSGKISITGISPGTYYVMEGSHGTTSINSKYQCSSSNPQKVTITAGGTSSVSFHNVLRPGSLSVTKTTEDNLNKGNWPFNVYSNSACTSLVSGPHYTDSNGKVTISGLAAGTYYIKEGSHGTSSINSKYQCSSTNPQKVTITAGGTTAVSFHNTLRLGSLALTKTTEDSQNLGNWPFDLYSDEACSTKVSGPHYTDSSGKLTITGLVPGTYYIREGNHGTASLNSRYYCASTNPQAVTITAGGTATVTFHNKLNLGSVKLIKQTNTETNCGGWIIGLYTDSACTNKVSGSPFTTGEDGVVMANNLAPGTYYAKEESSSDPMWECDTEVKTVTVTANQTTSVTFYNIHYGSMMIEKIMKPSGSAEGWQFKVTNTDGVEIDGSPFTMTASGKIVIDKLLPGEYTVEELAAENSLYFCESENPQVVTITAGKAEHVPFTNCLKSGSIGIHKVNIRNDPLAGAKFKLEWSEDGTAWQAVQYSDKPYPVMGACGNEAVENGCLTTGEDGIVEWTNLYPGILYRVMEQEAPSGYILLTEAAFQGELPEDDLTVNLRVVNGEGFTMPDTGSSDALILALLLILYGASFAYSMITIRKKWW